MNFILEIIAGTAYFSFFIVPPMLLSFGAYMLFVRFVKPEWNTRQNKRMMLMVSLCVYIVLQLAVQGVYFSYFRTAIQVGSPKRHYLLIIKTRPSFPLQGDCPSVPQSEVQVTLMNAITGKLVMLPLFTVEEPSDARYCHIEWISESSITYNIFRTLIIGRMEKG